MQYDTHWNLLPPSEEELVRTFVGRRRELRTLRAELLSPGRRAVLITGGAGKGKTSLALMFAYQEAESFPGGIIYADVQDFWRGTDVGILFRDTSAPLLILDELHSVPEQQANDLLARIIQQSPLVRMLLISQVERNLQALPGLPVVRLDNFTAKEVGHLARRLLGGPKIYPLSLYEHFTGQPLITRAVLQAVVDGLFEPQEALNATAPFQAAGVIGPDGKPLEADSAAHKVIVSDVTGVSDELLLRLSGDPKALYELSPRLFEEVVAEILKRMGYGVKLTPASRDGGKDIYVARRDDLGSFLYLVECKKFSPDNPVGVGLIRKLFGAVEAERATAGILATTSFFTKDAREFQRTIGFRISLQDYFGIQKWITSLKGRPTGGASIERRDM